MDLDEYRGFYLNNWIILSSHETDLLKGFLLASSRHLYMVHLQPEYHEIATAYKLQYIRGLQKILPIDDPAVKRLAITRTIVLMLDEVRVFTLRRTLFGTIID
jgi:hypothetical protein